MVETEITFEKYTLLWGIILKRQQDCGPVWMDKFSKFKKNILLNPFISQALSNQTRETFMTNHPQQSRAQTNFICHKYFDNVFFQNILTIFFSDLEYVVCVVAEWYFIFRG